MAQKLALLLELDLSDLAPHETFLEDVEPGPLTTTTTRVITAVPVMMTTVAVPAY